MRELVVFLAIIVLVWGQKKAIVKLQGSPSVTGEITIQQEYDPDRVHITGTVRGLTPGQHGFHVHEYGDIVTNGCKSTGGHYNPFGKEHGGPTATERHVGDLGNIEANVDGVATVNIYDSQVTICGRHSVIGRAIVVHAGVDDLGLGGQSDSKTTGHAGGRVACGVIGMAP